jgi:hypothetical protein
MLEVLMEDKLFCINGARFSFTSFIIFLGIAGIIIAVIPAILDILFSSWRLLTGDPEISARNFFSPFISVVLAPIEAIISGIILYPVYKRLFKNNIKLSLKIYGTE